MVPFGSPPAQVEGEAAAAGGPGSNDAELLLALEARLVAQQRDTDPPPRTPTNSAPEDRDVVDEATRISEELERRSNASRSSRRSSRPSSPGGCSSRSRSCHSAGGSGGSAGPRSDVATRSDTAADGDKSDIASASESGSASSEGTAGLRRIFRCAKVLRTAVGDPNTSVQEIAANLLLPVPAGAPATTKAAAALASTFVAKVALACEEEIDWKQIKFAIRDAQRAAAATATATTSEQGSGGISSGMSSDAESFVSAGDSTQIDGVSSGSTGSIVRQMMQTSMASTLIPSVVLSVLPEDKRRILENTLAAVLSSTGKELAALQASVENSSERAVVDRNNAEEMQAKFDKLMLQHEATELLRDQLAKSRSAMSNAQEARDELSDKLAGANALLEARSARHDQEVADLKTEFKHASLIGSEAYASMQAKLEESVALAMAKEEKAAKARITADKEREILRQRNLIAENQSKAEISHLHMELKAARREMSRLSSKTLNAKNDFEEQRQLEESLSESQEHNARLGRDLAAMRLQLLTAQTEREEEVAELKAVQLGSRPFLLNAKRRAPKGTSKLKAIDEEDSFDIASQAASDISGKVSTDGGEGVGDVTELEGLSPKASSALAKLAGIPGQAEDLREKLTEAEQFLKRLSDEKTATDAEHVARIARLFQHIQEFKEEATTYRDLLDRMKLSDAEKDAARAVELAEVARRTGIDSEAEVNTLQTQVSRLLEMIEERDRQIALANEAKRLTGIRLQDMKHEMESMEVRHAKAMKDLEARLQLARDPSQSEDAGAEIWSRLMSAEEDSNMLKNELEFQTVRWQAQLELQQQQCGAVEAKIADERKLSTRCQDRAKAAEERLRQAQEELDATRSALREAQEKLAAMSSDGCNGKNGYRRSGSGDVGVANLLSLLRCPARAQAAAPAATVGSTVPCQSVVWQIVSTMSGVTALICTGDSLTIQDASRRAFAMFGSSGLRGASLLSLVYDEAARDWIKSEVAAISGGTSLSGGAGATAHAGGAGNGVASEFVLRQLGCLEFRNRLGSAFDSSVFYARLPADFNSNAVGTADARHPVILVVVEPLEDSDPAFGGGAAMPTSRSGGDLRLRSSVPRRTTQGSGRRAASVVSASSVHSEDINANDSVSNVNAG